MQTPLCALRSTRRTGARRGRGCGCGCMAVLGGSRGRQQAQGGRGRAAQGQGSRACAPRACPPPARTHHRPPRHLPAPVAQHGLPEGRGAAARAGRRHVCHALLAHAVQQHGSADGAAPRPPVLPRALPPSQGRAAGVAGVGRPGGLPAGAVRADQAPAGQPAQHAADAAGGAGPLRGHHHRHGHRQRRCQAARHRWGRVWGPGPAVPQPVAAACSHPACLLPSPSPTPRHPAGRRAARPQPPAGVHAGRGGRRPPALPPPHRHAAGRQRLWDAGAGGAVWRRGGRRGCVGAGLACCRWWPAARARVQR